jgi:pSer/pThr/pTyr-binding forkhead associated (FHA) protein
LLSPSALKVGRADGADLCIAWDSSVSRQHAEIGVDTSGAYIRDLGSRNGTSVNGMRIDVQRLVDGDRVKFGNAEFVYRA